MMAMPIKPISPPLPNQPLLQSLTCNQPNNQSNSISKSQPRARAFHFQSPQSPLQLTIPSPRALCPYPRHHLSTTFQSPKPVLTFANQPWQYPNHHLNHLCLITMSSNKSQTNLTDQPTTIQTNYPNPSTKPFKLSPNSNLTNHHCNHQPTSLITITGPRFHAFDHQAANARSPP
jgi:hypothetical protein